MEILDDDTDGEDGEQRARSASDRTVLGRQAAYPAHPGVSWSGGHSLPGDKLASGKTLVRCAAWLNSWDCFERVMMAR